MVVWGGCFSVISITQEQLTTLKANDVSGALQHCDIDIYERQLRMLGIRSVLRSESPSELR